MFRRTTIRLVSVSFSFIGVFTLASTHVVAAERFWITTTGGSFSSTSNWSATDGGAGGFSVPVAADTANFTLNNTYDVNFSAAVTNTRLDVENGNVTFDLGGNIYTGTSPTAITVGNTAGQTARLTVLNGRLAVDTTGDDVSIGTADSTGFLTIGAGGQLGSAGFRPDVSVASIGTATLTVQNNGSMFADALTAGGLIGSSGTINVTGPLASVDAFSLTGIGFSGTGTMTLSAGAEFVGNGSTTIGFNEDGVGTVTVTGAGSHWSQGGMTVGNLGQGTLNVQSAAALTTNTGTIGLSTGGFGTATVTGSNSTWNVGTSLIVGNSGEGVLTVSGGGRISAGSNVTIGNLAGSEGTATITGTNSRLDAGGFIEVGHDSPGSLTISAGGQATSGGSGIATFSAAGSGDVTITDAGSSWTNTSDVNIGTTGTGTLTVRNGANLTVDASIIIGDGAGTPIGTLTLDGGTIETGGFISNGFFDFRDGTLHVKNSYDNGAVQGPLNIDGTTPADLPTLRLSGNFAVAEVGNITVGNTNQGALVIDGGRAINIGANNISIGARVSSSGTVTLVGNNTSLTTTNTLAVGGSGGNAGGVGALNIGAGSTVEAGFINLYAQGVINLNGGKLRVGVFSPQGGSVNFNAGEVVLTTAAILSDSQLDSLLGAGHVLGAGQQLSGTTSLSFNAPLTVSGGDVLATTSISNQSTLQVDAGSLTATTTLTNNFGRVLAISGSAAVVATGGITNSGTIQLNENLTAVDGGTLTNNGTIRGSGYISNALTNIASGLVQVTSGQRLQFQGASNTNSGVISFVGGEVVFTSTLTNSASTGLISGGDAILRASGGLTNQGSLAVSFGNNNVFGDINNTGSVVVTGGAHATFYDDITQNGTFIVRKIGSTNSTAVVLGAFTGAGGSSGGGDIVFEGDLRPGNSAATVNFVNNIAFGPATTLRIELGGITPGLQFDQVHVMGDLALDGTLAVSLINFSPAAGNSFDILDWTTKSGTFASIQLPALAGGLMWNAAQLYTAGVLRVVIAGDYNADGTVNAADYTVWRNSLNQIGFALAADGNGDHMITRLDFDVCKSHYGQANGSGAHVTESLGKAELAEVRDSELPVPEPATLLLAAVALCVVPRLRRVRYH